MPKAVVCTTAAAYAAKAWAKAAVWKSNSGISGVGADLIVRPKPPKEDVQQTVKH